MAKVLKKLILVGLPGAGKSTIGRQLAQRCGLPFSDLDTLLEEKLGCAIRDFFQQNGEEAFRDAEQDLIAELMQSNKPMLLATGGGAVLRKLNRQNLRKGGVVFYLRATPEQLFKRLQGDTKRPLLQVEDPLAKLKSLHAERDGFYKECAHFTIDTQNSSRNLLLNKLSMQIEMMP